MVDLIKLMEGIQNSVFIKEQVEQVAEERIQHCNSCEHYSPNLKNKGLKILHPYKYCDICKCNMYLKTRSLAAQCPIGESHRKNKDGTLKFPGTPKWTAITTDAKLSEHLLEVGMKEEIIDYKTKLQKNQIDEHGS